MNIAFQLSVPEGQPTIADQRDVAAPVGTLFRAHPEPELLARWAGPKEAGIRMTRFGFQPGGGYAYRQVGEQGRGQVFNGIFHAVVENELMIQTKEFDGVLELVGIETEVFTDLGQGRSRLSGHNVYRSQGARDAMA